MKQYKLANDLAGWLVFLVALVTYTLTLESTTSFWDCGEFISGAYRLQVVHPPGAPMFLLLGRLATMFAFEDPNWIAWTVNFLSGLTSAFSVLFLFWITTHFARKIVVGAGQIPTAMQTAVVIATGAIAGLACTFTDTIWFSAVEGEVYAMSLFFMMLVFWTMLKWESCEDERYQDKWLVLTFFLLGISSGVHLLSFLAIPPMALIYYYKEFKNPKPLGILVSLFVGFVILGFFFKGIVSGLISIIASFELFAVNTLGLGVGVGFGVFALLLFGFITAGIYLTRNTPGAALTLFRMPRQKVHVGLLCLLMVMIGFSTYTIVVIRASADTPINMNNPDNVFMLESYLNREQYGSRALVYGPNYTAYPTEIEEKGLRYFPIEDKATGKVRYEVIGKKVDYKFAKEDMMFMPRMGSWNDDRHVMAYRAMLNPDFSVVDRRTGQVVKKFLSDNIGWQQALGQANAFAQSSKDGSLVVKDVINQRDNLSFFFNYQVGVMYLRYFFWNFTGRQNDIQGRFDNNEGKGITGIAFIDNMIIGPTDNLPEWRQSNAGYNKYFLLPFLLGLVGMFFHAKQDWKGFSIILVLFLFTGVLQVIYLNSPPFEPRERDYTLVGSFVTFCLWIGFGMLAIFKALENGKLSSKLALSLSFVVCLAVPAVLVSQNWDDHDRSDRYTARDFAVNYLESCAPNAIIFTQGDNDTYPLWYAQEVEGIRKDIRVVNLSLLGVDWYVQQLEYKMNDAPAVKLSLTPEKYRGNTRDVVRFYDTGKYDQKSFYPLKDVISYIANDGNKLRTQGGDMVEVFPVKNFYMPVDKQQIINQKIVPEKYYENIVDQLRWSLGGKTNLLKNDLVTLDIVASNLWERPIYFAVSVSPDAYLGLDKYFQLEGLAYRIVPVESSNGGNGYIAQEMMLENAMNKFRWGGIDRKKTIEYTVGAGETLDSIAYAHNQTAAQLMAFNSLTSKDVAAGTKLKIEVPQWIYLDENINRMTMNLRSNFGRLAEDLLASGNKEGAIKVLDESLRVMPGETVPYNVFMLRYPEIYYKAGARDKAQLLVRKVLDHTMQEFIYLQDVKEFEPGYKRDSEQSIAIISELRRIATANQDQEMVDIINASLMKLQGLGAF